MVLESLGSAWRQEAWQRFASIVAAQLQLKVLGDNGYVIQASSTSQTHKQLLPGFPENQCEISDADQSQVLGLAQLASAGSFEDFESPSERGSSVSCREGSTNCIAKPEDSNSRCLNETWERALCIFAQWLCTSSESKGSSLLVGLRCGVCDQEANFDGCESLRLLLSVMAAVRMEPVDWRAALEAAHGKAFASLVFRISRMSAEDDVPFHSVCRALARSPLTLDVWGNPLAVLSRGSERQVAMIRPLLSEVVHVKVAYKKSTFVTIAKSVGVASSVTVSLHFVSEDSGPPHLFISLACGISRTETKMNIGKGECALVVPAGEIIFLFGRPYVCDIDASSASIELPLLPFRFEFLDFHRQIG